MQRTRIERSTYITDENARDILRVLIVTALAYPLVAWFRWYLPFVLFTIVELILVIIALPRLSHATAHDSDVEMDEPNYFANESNKIIVLLASVLVGLALGAAWPILAAFSVGLLVQTSVIVVRTLIRSLM
jgi:hypothetical protein